MLVDAAPARALAIYAHPNDADLACGGTLARWAAAGSHVVVVVCTQGEKGGHGAQVDAVALAEQRADEARAAAATLGVVGQHHLGHPDGEVENDHGFRAELVALIRSERPETVLCPDPTAVFFGSSYVNHRDHRIVGWAAIDAVAPAAASAAYFPEAGPPHQVSELWLSGSLEPDSWVDVGSWLPAKIAALECHRSQLGDSGAWVRTAVEQRASEAGAQASVALAEAFRRLVLAG